MMHAKRPDFVVIGAPRSGSSSLTAMLASHPDIFMARKELHFFGRDLEFHRVPMTAERYREHYAIRPAHTKRAGDSSPWTIFSESAPAEIAEYSPDAQIIAILRSPAEMMHSIHGLLVYGCHENIGSFDRAVQCEEERSRGWNIPEPTRPKMALQYTSLGRYHTYITRWLEVFGRERVHVILLDDLKADAAAEGVKIADFLGLESPIRPIGSGLGSRSRNAHRVYYSSRLQMWTQKQSNRKMVDGVVPFTPWRRVAIGLVNRLNGRFTDRVPMSERTRAHIYDIVRPEIEALGTLLDRDLNHWVTM